MGLRTYLSKLPKCELDKLKENANLTEDEREIFELVSRGKLISEIAYSMNVCTSTVDRKIRNINRKMEECEKMSNQIPVWEKANLTVKEAAEYSNIGEKKIRDLLKTPNCPFCLYIGSKMLVKRKAFLNFLEKEIEI